MEAEPKDITCPRCHAEQFTVVDQTTGLLRCDYCRNQWIDSRFIKLSETEKFIAEQAKQPKVIIDNTTDTDRQLMEMIGGVMGGGLLGQAQGCLTRFTRTILIIVIALIVLAAIGFIAPNINWNA
jgi:Zn-finger nucleic acid-binding protein